jgi:hypothetical protein
MSMPISSVGVQESRFGNHGFRSAALNWVSISSRSGRSRRPVCSSGKTRWTCPREMRLPK